MTTPDTVLAAPNAVQPAAAPAPPGCTACGNPSYVHWQRRLNPDEITEQQAAEQARRDAELAEWQQIVDSLAGTDTPTPPRPEYGPLPDCADYTRTIYACLSHAIAQDAAAHIHQGTCTAPDPAVLPACNCTPEPLPTPDPAPEPRPLPPGWS